MSRVDGVSGMISQADRATDRGDKETDRPMRSPRRAEIDEGGVGIWVEVYHKRLFSYSYQFVLTVTYRLGRV